MPLNHHSMAIGSRANRLFNSPASCVSFPSLLLFLFGCLFFFLSPLAARAGLFHGANVKEYEKEFVTYPYSDPDPIPVMSRFYPYFRYDGFTDTSVKKKWKVVELSNEHVTVLILPEIGGKVWAAIEKSTGKPFIYYNHVVKFRDVSMRGPWTSGGMEANYGIIGHTPNCFSPVDYVTRRNSDGSVSCIIGTLDLLTRTTWRLDINLPSGQAGFSTRSFWHNGSAAEQPYYTWMNVGIKAAGGLQFVNPGTHFIGHDGKASDWPVDRKTGRDLSWYDRNNFGSYKSYHVIGRIADFFGGYYHDEDFGMARCSIYGDKPGRKIWIWGLSRQGMIWEKLLTDADGQYVEVQSGRLFNQAAEESSLTPFKNREFPPYTTDEWTEHWQPIKGIKGMVAASPWGAMNVVRDKEHLVIRISPTRAFTDNLEVFDGPRLLWSGKVVLKPMQPREEKLTLPSEPAALRVCLGGGKLQYVANADDILSRPVESPAGFNWTSDYGLYLKGRESSRLREYVRAGDEFQSCLKSNPDFIPALVEMAALANRRGNPAAARDFALRALAVDTYDPAANYHFGLASASLNRSADARDALSIAALTPAWRGAASTELAKLHLRERRFDRALESAAAALDCNRRNLDAIQVQACAARLRGDARAAAVAARTLLELDPLNHFARFENHLNGRASAVEFARGLRNEFPHETCLEIAAWYRGVGRDQDAARVLDLAKPNAEVLYWLAFLRRDTNLLARAADASPAFVFPFRPESIPVFEWAASRSSAWQPRYYLALVFWHQGDLARAGALLAECGDQPDFAPFYSARAQIADAGTTPDLERAARLDPAQWRHGSMLVKHHLKQNNLSAALIAAGSLASRFPGSSVVAILHARCLLLNGNHRDAAAILDTISLLPAEGRTDARNLFREAQLMLALDQMKTGAFAEALPLIARARDWPERLGAGKPYDDDIDERLESWLDFQCHLGRKADSDAKAALDRILAFRLGAKPAGVGDVIRALALQQSGRTGEAESLMKTWSAQQPSNPLPQWGEKMLKGDATGIPSTDDPACRVLAAWSRQRNPNTAAPE